MKAFIVVLIVMVAVAAAAPSVDKRNALTDLLNKLRTTLASHPDVTEGVCEATCHTIAGLFSLLCGEACALLVREIGG